MISSVITTPFKAGCEHYSTFRDAEAKLNGRVITHLVVGVLEIIPALGHLVYLIERIVKACLSPSPQYFFRTHNQLADKGAQKLHIVQTFAFLRKVFSGEQITDSSVDSILGENARNHRALEQRIKLPENAARVVDDSCFINEYRMQHYIPQNNEQIEGLKSIKEKYTVLLQSLENLSNAYIYSGAYVNVDGRSIGLSVSHIRKNSYIYRVFDPYGFTHQNKDNSKAFIYQIFSREEAAKSYTNYQSDGSNVKWKVYLPAPMERP